MENMSCHHGQYQKDMLAELQVGHPGIVRMKELALITYLWWPNVDLEIEQSVRNCGSCQQVWKSPTVSPLALFMWPSNPWQRVHIDFAEYKRRHYFILVDDIPAGPKFSACP